MIALVKQTAERYARRPSREWSRVGTQGRQWALAFAARSSAIQRSTSALSIQLKSRIASANGLAPGN